MKKKKLIPMLALSFGILFLAGCAKKIPHTLVAGYDNRNIKTIAILPIQEAAKNPEVSALLRKRLADAIYLKGYPKVSEKEIDERLGVVYKNVKDHSPGTLPPRDVGGILGVDAVLYTVLQDCQTSFLYLSASTSIAVSFNMYSTQTGELLWSTRYQIGERNFDITRDRLKMKSCQAYEPALDEIVRKAMETLPDAPDV